MTSICISFTAMVEIMPNISICYLGPGVVLVRYSSVLHLGVGETNFVLKLVIVWFQFLC